MLNITRRALHIRRTSSDLLVGDFAWLPNYSTDDGILAFARWQSHSATRTVCIVNMGSKSVPLPAAEVIVASAPFENVNSLLLAPNSAVWMTS